MGFSYLNVFNSLFFDIESHKDIKRTLEQASDVLDSLITKFGEIQNELTLGISGNDDFVDTNGAGNVSAAPACFASSACPAG